MDEQEYNNSSGTLGAVYNFVFVGPTISTYTGLHDDTALSTGFRVLHSDPPLRRVDLR